MVSPEEQPNTSRILVIGSSGFIGSHLTERLAASGHHVVGFDLSAPEHAFGTAEFIQGDVRSAADLERALNGIDAVINLAAVHFDFGHEPAEYFETNDTGMVHLLDAMAAANVRRLVFTSSIAVYGDRTDEPDEETPPSPTSPYGASKLAAEERVNHWIEQDPSRCVTVIRPCAVYGERNISNMMNLIRQVYSGFFVLFGSGTNPKATAYVGNLVDAIHLQFDQLSPGIKIFNYADKPDMSVREIVGIIRQELGRSPRSLSAPLWLGMLAAIPFEFVSKLTGKNFPVSMARVKKLAQPTKVAAQRIREAGFEQQVATAEGLGRMVRHFMQQKQQQQQDQPAEHEHVR